MYSCQLYQVKARKHGIPLLLTHNNSNVSSKNSNVFSKTEVASIGYGTVTEYTEVATNQIYSLRTFTLQLQKLR
jgi:hypothetical protein